MSERRKRGRKRGERKKTVCVRERENFQPETADSFCGNIVLKNN